MKKWRCSVCGYIWEGETPPVQCPVCRAATDKFVEMTGEREKSENPAMERPGRVWLTMMPMDAVIRDAVIWI